MLRLRGPILARLLSSSTTYPASLFQRPLSATAPLISPNPNFTVEDYLVGTCGLTRDQALKSSAKLSHLKSPSNPDAVLAFLTGLGLCSADVAALVTKDPKFLCTSVERTLTPILVGLTGLGLSHSDIAGLVSATPDKFRCRSVVSSLLCYLPLFGSLKNLLRAVQSNTYLLGSSLERTVKPNIAILRECGLGACDIGKLCFPLRTVLSSKPERLQAAVARAERLGVPRGSGMFRHALQAVGCLSQEMIDVKVDYLKKTLSWSDAEVRNALCKLPTLLTKSNDMLQRRSEFLFYEVGLEPAYLAHRPALLAYSLEGRLKPRYHAVKFLKENGLIKRDPSYYTVAKDTEKVFTRKFICPHKEAVPHLSEDYAAACRGEMPTSFRFR